MMISRTTLDKRRSVSSVGNMNYEATESLPSGIVQMHGLSGIIPPSRNKGNEG